MRGMDIRVPAITTSAPERAHALQLSLLKTLKNQRNHRVFGAAVIPSSALLSALGSLLSFRVRSRAALELELVALRHQLTVLRLSLLKTPKS